MCVQPPEEKSLKIGEFGNHEVRAKHACVLSYVRLFVSLRTAAHKAPLSMGFSPVSCHYLLQGIFLTQESNLHFLHLLHCQVDSLPLSRLGSPEQGTRLCIRSLSLSVVNNYSFMTT